MQALLVTPDAAGSARVAELPAPRPEEGEVLLRTLDADRLVGLRVEADRFEEAFAYRGGKATLQFA